MQMTVHLATGEPSRLAGGSALSEVPMILLHRAGQGWQHPPPHPPSV